MHEVHSIPDPDVRKPSTTGPTTARREKPAKPYSDFPLTPHPAGYWCKRIRGKLHYFGRWEDSDGALAKYLEQKVALHAGKEPRPDPDALTVKALANAFLNHKKNQVDAGELSPRTWIDYKRVCDLLIDQFGKRRLVDEISPEDLAGLRKKMAAKWGPVHLGNTIQRIRVVFRFAADNRLVDKPVAYGQGFKRPSVKTLRKLRAEKGPRMFQAEEIRAMLDAAGQPLRTMTLLGINAGFGCHAEDRRLGPGRRLGPAPPPEKRHRTPLPPLARIDSRPAGSAGEEEGPGR